MAFTKINAAGIGTTETVTVDGLTVINDGSFGGNLTVSGVLTYEDVTNVDSVGLITARNGIVVGSGITLSKDGDIFATGITTVSGNVKVGTGITLSPDGDVFFTGIITGNGSGLTNLATDLVNDTSPQLGGDLASNGNDILFADNDKAIFGTGSDLKIYHNGTDNYIMASNGHIRFDTGSAELARITSDGKLLIGTTTEGEASADDLTIGGSGNQGITIRSGTSNYGLIYFSDATSGSAEYAGAVEYKHDDNFMVFRTDASERVRIDSSGHLKIGATANRDLGGLSVQRLHIEGTDGGGSGVGIVNNQNSAGYPSIRFGKSRGTSVGSNTVVQDDDPLGGIIFCGADGTDMASIGAQILAEVDGTPGSNDMPTRLEFFTRTDGVSSPTERLRIESDGDFRLSSGDAGTNYAFIRGWQSSTGDMVIGADQSATGTGTSKSNLIFRCRGSEKMRVTSGSGVGINTITPRANTQNSVPGLHIVGRGIDPMPHYDGYADLIVESIESRLQITSSSGGTNASSIIMSSVVASDDNKHWVMEAAGSSQSYKFHLGYLETTATQFDSGGVTPDISITTDGAIEHVPVANLFYTASVAGAVRLQFNHTGGGNITISNPSSGNVTYSTSSDYRLKENATTINNALTTVKALKPYQFTWKHDSQIGQGFLAHEAQAVLPDVGIVSGTKDAVHSEDNLDLGVKAGDPIYQGIDYSKLVPLLTAALQEEIAKRESLEARIAALEG